MCIRDSYKTAAFQNQILKHKNQCKTRTELTDQLKTYKENKGTKLYDFNISNILVDDTQHIVVEDSCN